MKASRSKAMKQVRSRTRRFTLESLENRTLLSANPIDAAIDWHELEHDVTDQFAKEGYGHADPVFSDPSTWDADFLANIPYIDSSESSSESKPVTLEDLFTESLSSTATTDYTLYLNFDAARVYSQAGDFWLGSTYIDVPGYDLSMYGWENLEEISKGYITNFVAEDYAAYDVTVTNVEPTSGEYTTMYIGGTSDWFQANSNIIGVASYDINNRDASNYGFAFTEELSTYYSYSSGSIMNFSEYVANLVSHEAAHTFGATHIDDSSYIMNPYLPTSPRTSSFGNGPLSSSSGTQDTQDLLGANLGYLNTSDDYGDSISNAEAISLSTTTITGLLENMDDTDAFTFTATDSGEFTVELSTTIYGNLDSTLTIYDEDGDQVAYNDDYYGSVDSKLTFDVTANTEYTIVVGSSYSESSGSYTLDLTAPEGTPEIVVTDTEGNSSDLTIDFGDVFIGENQTYTIKIKNIGQKDLNITQISTSGNFDIDLPNGKSSDLEVNSGGYTTISVTFDPETVSTENGQIIIQSDDADNPTVVINISGKGLSYDSDIEIANAEEGTVDFGVALTDSIGTGKVTISNTGTSTLEISSIVMPNGFNIDIETLTVASGESEDIDVWFTSDTTVTLSGNMVINSNDPDEPVTTVALTADIYTQEDFIANSQLTFNEADGVNDGIINGGDVKTGVDTEIDLWIISNEGTLDATIDLSNILGSVFAMPTEVTIAAGETYTLSTTFSSSMPYGYTDQVTATLSGEQIATPLEVNVDAYTEFGGRDRFDFVDSDGDFVSVMLKNATGKIKLGTDGEPDIKSIEIEDSSSKTNLTIKTKRGGYTKLGDIVSDGDIKSISAKTTDISGEIDIDGDLGKLQLNDISESAVLNFGTDYKGANIQFNNTAGSIDIDGTLKSIKADGDIGGDITVNGEINSIKTKYDISATINANGYIKTVNALNLEDAEISSSSYIKTVNLKGDMIDSSISAGYSEEFGYSQDLAQINRVSVRGLYQGSTITSGLTAEQKSSTEESSKPFISINNIKIGTVDTDNDGETFGIFAGGFVKRVNVGKEKITENYQDNDFVVMNEQ